MLSKQGTNYFQIGRTLVEATIKEPAKMCSISDLCRGSKHKAQKGSLAYDGEDFFPVEFMQKPNEHTVEDDKFMKDNKAGEGANPTFHNRSQALENMTEHLQGNIEDEENPIPDDMPLASERRGFELMVANN